MRGEKRIIKIKVSFVEISRFVGWHADPKGGRVRLGVVKTKLMH